MTLLADLVAASQRTGETSSRLAKTREIAALLHHVSPDEVAIAVAYLAGETRQGRSGIGYALVRGAHPDTAAATSTLTLADVDGALDRIATASGHGSAAQRSQLLRDLFARATAAEQEFLVRLLLGELRQGALEGVMIEAVAQAAAIPVMEVRRAAMIAGGIVSVTAVAMQEGEPGLQRFAIALFQPVVPMLAQPADDVADALTKVGVAALEWKLDGARVHVHKSGDQIRIYTRSLNDVTAAAPEIVEAIAAVDAHDLIVDGEAIALRDNGAPQPFQVTMRRFGRRLDVPSMLKTLPLSVLFFDCLRYNGEDLLRHPGQSRFRTLCEALPSSLIVPRLVTQDATAAQDFYGEAIDRGHEGVMVKALDAPYQPGVRSASWLKVKRAHTLDLVVLAAEWGHGRRHRWLSNLHLGARDPATGDFVMLGKTFKGMTDAMLEWQTGELKARAIRQDEWTVFVRPELVVEIAFNDLQQSPRYPGGLALRFARVKGYRPDKKPEEADTIDAVRQIYARQQQ